MKPETKILTRRADHYAVDHALVVRQRYDDSQTTLQIRRVIPSGDTEQVQMEITIEKFHEKRTSQMHSSFICPPEIADAITKAFTELRK